MTDINLKTLTPDTSLPTTGFLFGADSQASTNPSVYSTQTVATTLLGSTSLTGDTLTASAPVLDLAQTWNSVGTTFTGVRFNAAGSSSTNSAAASLLMDLQTGGTSQFKVDKTGSLTLASNITSNLAAFNITSSGTTFVNGTTYIGSTFGSQYVSSSGARADNIGLCTWSTGAFSWTSGNLNTAKDTFLTRSTKNTGANIQLGAADAASPVAQTLSVQSVVAGTTGNVAGQPFTITGSQGVGSGAGGSLIFQVAPAGSTATFTVTFTNGSATINGTGLPTTAGTAVAFTTTGALPTNFAINTTYFVLAGSTSTAITVAATAGGTAIVAGSAGSGTQTLTQAVAQNALSTALTINSSKQAVFGSGTGGLPSIVIGGANSGLYEPYTSQIGISIASSFKYLFGPGAFTVGSDVLLRWTNSGDPSGSPDTNLSRAAAGIIQVGNSVSGNALGTLKAAVVGTTTAYTVATLPTGFQGARAFVTDATLPTYLGTLTGGGAVVCPVFYNGSAWVSA
jgi:hypothetical protein